MRKTIPNRLKYLDQNLSLELVQETAKASTPKKYPKATVKDIKLKKYPKETANAVKPKQHLKKTKKAVKPKKYSTKTTKAVIAKYYKKYVKLKNKKYKVELHNQL